MTANDSDVSDADVLTGSQVVRVYGQNLTAPFVTLTFGDVEYTPLAQGEGYIEFILGDNGTYTINVDGSPFMSFEVEGIVVPTGLPNRFIGRQRKESGSFINEVVINRTTCMNYPYLIDNEFPTFSFQIGRSETPFSDIDILNYEGENCTVNVRLLSGNTSVLMTADVVEPEKVAYVTYKGFIVAVFNYTTD